MRHSAEWMSVWDDRILEAAKEHGAVSVRELSKHERIHVSKATVSRRCSKLEDHGLLGDLGVGSYVLSEKGDAYLSGEYNVQGGCFEENVEGLGNGEFPGVQG